jgi:hypothetical protein
LREREWRDLLHFQSGVSVKIGILIDRQVPCKNEKWSAEDDRRLLELKAAGKADAVMGHALGRSAGSIAARLAKLHSKTARLERAAASN